MGGISLGGAYFELNANSASLIQEMAKAEAASKKSVEAISKLTGVAEKDVARFANTYIRAEKAKADAAAAATLKIIKGYNDQADAAEKAAKRTADANKRAGGSFIEGAKGAAGFALGLGGITGAAVAATAAIHKVATATQEQAQAQFAINKLYGDLSPLVTKNAEALATYAGKSKTEALEAAAAVATLGRSYGLNIKQQDQVLKISADLAAVRGISLAEATERVQGALRGEAEAAEYLGQALNSDAVKAMANMTAEQRKNFESLGPLEKAQIVLGKLTGDNADLMGAAADRANTAAGAYDKLAATTADLGAKIGEKATPALEKLARALIEAAEAVDKYLEAYDRMRKSQGDDQNRQAQDFVNRFRRFLPPGLVAASDDFARRSANRAVANAEDLPSAQAQGRTSAAEQADAIKKRIAAAEEVRKRAVKAELEAADKANDKIAESAIAAIEAERKVKERWYDEERTRIEARRTYQLEDIEKRRDAAIKAIEEERDASKRASEAAIEQLEREKTSRIAAAEEARDRVIAALDAQAAANERAREIEDRERQDAQRDEDRQLATSRKNEDRYRELFQANELRRLEQRHEKVLADLDSEQKALEKASARQLRRLDEQSDAARRASEKAVRAIERQADAEDERHRKAVQALEDEQDVRLKIVDTQLKALDAQEKQADAAKRMADLQRKASDIERDLAKARGAGDPQAIAAAQAALTAAIRRNDQAAVLKARRDLDAAAGTGNPEEIEKLERDLADAHADIEEEKLDVTRDAERDKLKAAQDAIRDEIDARKQAEDDTTRARKRDLDAEKQNEQDKLAERLRALDKRKELTQDATKDEIEALGRRRQAEQRDYDDAVAGARRTFEAQSQILDDRRQKEDQDREDRRQNEDRERADRRRLEDEALEAQRKAAAKTFEQERAEAEVHYNGPNGLITQAKKASEARILEFNKQLAAARTAFEEERKSAEKIYTNADKNGLLDMLEKARNDEFNKLEQSKIDWQNWQKQVSESIKSALGDLDGFIASAGGATAAVSSAVAAAAAGKTSGDAVDVGAWLAAAMKETGVNSSWLKGLTQLVALESSGNPKAINPQKVGNENATGLLQTLPSTFKAHRSSRLPNDIFDPVANAAAAINYIKATYKHVDNIPGLYQGPPKFKGYADGGWIEEPIIGRGLHTGRGYTFGEREREFVTPMSQMGRPSRMTLTPPPTMANYARIGDMMASMHPGGSGSSYTDNSSVVFNGLTYDEAEVRQQRQLARKRALNAGRRRGPW